MVLILLLIIFGAIIGWIYSEFFNIDYRYGAVTDIILSITGTLLGSFITNLLGNFGIAHFGVYNVVAAIISAVLFIYLGRITFSKL